MNLYIFNQTRRGTIFGVGTYIRELTQALKGCGINVCVVNLISEKFQIQKEQVEGIEYWYFPLAIYDQRTKSNQEQWELYYRNIVYLLQLHIKDRNDLIFHLNFSECSRLAEELKNVFNCSIVATLHFFDWGFTVYDNLPRLQHILRKKHPNGFEDNLQKTFEREKLYYSKVDHVICLSNYMKEILYQQYGIDMNRISVIPNGLCDLANTSHISHLRKKWSISPKEKIILFAGRIDEVKGVFYLIKAFREVLKKNEDCRLIIAGNGDYDKCLQISNNIYLKITFTGLLKQQDLYELYQIAEMGVVPSLFEPFGYVPVEMMMHKLPIVATVTSGLNEVVDDHCGLKIPINILSDSVEIDTTLLSEKILYLLDHPTEAKLMGENGRRRYLNKYSSNIFSQKMLQVYKSMLTI